jgi:hypothetical protein
MSSVSRRRDIASTESWVAHAATSAATTFCGYRAVVEIPAYVADRHR